MVTMATSSRTAISNFDRAVACTYYIRYRRVCAFFTKRWVTHLPADLSDTRFFRVYSLRFVLGARHLMEFLPAKKLKTFKHHSDRFYSLHVEPLLLA